MLSGVHRLMDRLYVAQQAGTVGAIDRSKQYTDPTPAKVLQEVNEAHTKIRQLQTINDEKDKAILDLQNRLKFTKAEYLVLMGVVNYLALEGLKLLLASYFPAIRHILSR